MSWERYVKLSKKKKQQINKQKNRERKRILSWEGQRSGTELNAGLSDLRLNAG